MTKDDLVSLLCSKVTESRHKTQRGLKRKFGEVGSEVADSETRDAVGTKLPGALLGTPAARPVKDTTATIMHLRQPSQKAKPTAPIALLPSVKERVAASSDLTGTRLDAAVEATLPAYGEVADPSTSSPSKHRS